MKRLSLILRTGVTLGLLSLFGLGVNTDANYSQNFLNSVRLPVRTDFRGSTEVKYSLEKIIYEQYKDGIISDKEFIDFFDSKYGENYGLILSRYSKLQNKIKDLEDRLYIPDFKFVLMSESRLDSNAKSYRKAKGISQLTTDGVEGLIGSMKGDREAISKFFDIDKINELIKDRDFRFNPFEENLPYDTYGFKKDLIGTKDYEAYGSEWQITKVRLPRYIILRKLFGSGIDFDLAFKDPEHNLNVGAAIYFSYKLELSYFSKRFNYAKNSPNLLRGAYNRGITKIKHTILKNSRRIVVDNIYSLMNDSDATEAREHNERFIQYKDWFEELKKLGIVS